jgi:adenylate kinase family enzyme
MPGKRISVRGTSGSGKSTLGKALAEILQVEFTELDSLNHMEGWTERPVDDFRRLVSERVRGDGWVVDGNYARVRDLVMDRADTLVWLDYPLAMILYRLTIRIFRRAIRRELLWGVNRESLWRHFFSRESLYLWVLQTHRRRRRDADALFSQPNPGLTMIRLRSPSEANRWLDTVRREVTVRTQGSEPSASGV